MRAHLRTKFPAHDKVHRATRLSRPRKRRRAAGAIVARRLLVPFTVILEVGNHVGQSKDGTLRRRHAGIFVEVATKAVDGELPLAVAGMPERAELRALLDAFVAWSHQGSGLGDLSIRAVFDAQRALSPHARVYIWSLDAHLSAFDTGPR